jgi:hypothetical protein
MRRLLSHFSRSVARKAPNSAGVPALMSTESLASVAITSGDFRPALMAALSLAMMAGGTPAGATIPVNETDTKSGIVSLMVGTSGSRGLCASLVTAMARRVPASTSGSDTAGFSKVRGTWPDTTSWVEPPPLL